MPRIFQKLPDLVMDSRAISEGQTDECGCNQYIWLLAPIDRKRLQKRLQGRTEVQCRRKRTRTKRNKNGSEPDKGGGDGCLAY